MKKKIIIIACILIILITCFILYCRYIGTKGLIVKEYLIKNENIPDSFYGTKIVHISDILYKRTTKSNELKDMEKRINKIKPDIIIISGDILDKKVEYSQDDINTLIYFLNNIEASMGKYIIMGDNDFLNSQYENLIENIDFIDLNNNYQILYNNDKDAIMISGLSTITDNIEIDKKIDNIELSEMQSDNIKYSILVLHEPDMINDFDYENYNLILAGHSLNGQVILPLFGHLFLPKNAKKYYNEYYNLDGIDFYISSGIGTSINNLRLNNKPSFNLYRLVNK